jgi:DNA-binding NtrC family response regulator
VLDGPGADVVVTDLRMPELDGMALLARVRERYPTVPVIMLTAHGTVPTAVEAMRRGAADFMLKPFDREELLFVIDKALRSARHCEEQHESALDGNGPFVSRAPAMRDAIALIDKAARGTATVLLRGESGTGKEVAARAIHERSARASKAFVQIHCAALPDTLLESELFGYERGAFTGANTRKLGRIELAEGGTLFLDEIGDITAPMQVKLLRVLQEREIQRLGGVSATKVDVRFIAATHQPLEKLVEQKQFREDLFYRLNVIPIFLPPLRARPEDVDALAERFCATLGAANGRPGVRLEPSALELLRREPWPGNVRQLQNFIERLIVLADSDLLTADEVRRELGRTAPVSDAPVTLDAQRRAAEREALDRALASAGGNRAKAARLLGVSRRTLYNKLAELGID